MSDDLQFSILKSLQLYLMEHLQKKNVKSICIILPNYYHKIDACIDIRKNPNIFETKKGLTSVSRSFIISIENSQFKIIINNKEKTKHFNKTTNRYHNISNKMRTTIKIHYDNPQSFDMIVDLINSRQSLATIIPTKENEK